MNEKEQSPKDKKEQGKSREYYLNFYKDRYTAEGYTLSKNGEDKFIEMISLIKNDRKRKNERINLVSEFIEKYKDVSDLFGKSPSSKEMQEKKVLLNLGTLLNKVKNEQNELLEENKEISKSLEIEDNQDFEVDKHINEQIIKELGEDIKKLEKSIKIGTPVVLERLTNEYRQRVRMREGGIRITVNNIKDFNTIEKQKFNGTSAVTKLTLDKYRLVIDISKELNLQNPFKENKGGVVNIGTISNVLEKTKNIINNRNKFLSKMMKALSELGIDEMTNQGTFERELSSYEME